MHIFIFPHIEQLTRNYHPEGGLVIIAQDVDHARRLLAERAANERDWYTHEALIVTDEEWDSVVTYALAGEPEPALWVFPDAGCC